MRKKINHQLAERLDCRRKKSNFSLCEDDKERMHVCWKMR